MNCVPLFQDACIAATFGCFCARSATKNQQHPQTKTMWCVDAPFNTQQCSGGKMTHRSHSQSTFVKQSTSNIMINTVINNCRPSKDTCWQPTRAKSWLRQSRSLAMLKCMCCICTISLFLQCTLCWWCAASSDISMMPLCQSQQHQLEMQSDFASIYV